MTSEADEKILLDEAICGCFDVVGGRKALLLVILQ